MYEKKWLPGKPTLTHDPDMPAHHVHHVMTYYWHWMRLANATPTPDSANIVRTSMDAFYRYDALCSQLPRWKGVAR